MIKRKRTTLITGIICLFVLLGLTALYLHGYVRRSNLAEHVESMTGLSLKNLTVEEDGDIETVGGEEYGHIRLKLKKGGIEDVKVQLSAMGKTPLAEMKDNVPSYEEHRLAQDLKKETILACYPFFRTRYVFFGLAGRTSYSMEVYLSIDAGGDEYLYYFG